MVRVQSLADTPVTRRLRSPFTVARARDGHTDASDAGIVQGQELRLGRRQGRALRAGADRDQRVAGDVPLLVVKVDVTDALDPVQFGVSAEAQVPSRPMRSACTSDPVVR